jgi:hypothetical protein
MSLLELPPEMVTQILLSLPIEEILDKCRTSRFFNDICNSEQFWHAYAKEHHIPKTLNTWKDSVLVAIDVSFVADQKAPGRYFFHISILDHGRMTKVMFKINSVALEETLKQIVENRKVIKLGYKPTVTLTSDSRGFFIITEDGRNIQISGDVMRLLKEELAGPLRSLLIRKNFSPNRFLGNENEF